MTLQDDMSTIARYHTGGYGPHGPDCSICAALARVRERLAKLEAVAEAARNCRGTNHEQALRRAELRRAVAALDEDETVEGKGGYSEPEAPGKNAAPSERGNPRPRTSLSESPARGGFGEVNE